MKDKIKRKGDHYIPYLWLPREYIHRRQCTQEFCSYTLYKYFTCWIV